MSAARLVGAFVPVLLFVIAVVGAWWALRRERRQPSSYTRQPDVQEAWRGMATAAQAAHDDAVLDASEAAEVAAREAGARAAARLRP